MPRSSPSQLQTPSCSSRPTPATSPLGQCWSNASMGRRRCWPFTVRSSLIPSGSTPPSSGSSWASTWRPNTSSISARRSPSRSGRTTYRWCTTSPRRLTRAPAGSRGSCPLSLSSTATSSTSRGRATPWQTLSPETPWPWLTWGSTSRTSSASSRKKTTQRGRTRHSSGATSPWVAKPKRSSATSAPANQGPGSQGA